MSHAFVWGAPFAGPAYTPDPPRAPRLTHEAFCHQVRDLAVGRIMDPGTKARLLGAKLVYGAGAGHYRGICHYGAWTGDHAFIEIAATGEESPVQLAGTTVHETAHVLAGHGAGHGKVWKECCARLGLMDAMAAGQEYTPQSFDPTLWDAIEALGKPDDGVPTFGGVAASPFGIAGLLVGRAPCPAGRGSRGGKSTGPGSGRLRKFACACPQPVRVYAARDVLEATCQGCGEQFHRV